MKRMVENSENLEKLGNNFNIIDESDYEMVPSSISHIDSLYIFNIGTALVVQGSVDPGNGNTEYGCVIGNSKFSNLDCQMLSNGDEIYADKIKNEDGTYTYKINFDNASADVQKSNYSFSFIIGKAPRQV